MRVGGCGVMGHMMIVSLAVGLLIHRASNAQLLLVEVEVEPLVAAESEVLSLS
jgi:hypothetical protein